MKTFFNLRRTRSTATLMLFVWVMSLAVGLSNACVLDEAQGHSGHVHTGVTAHDEQDADHHSMASDKVACQDFCAAEQMVAVKIKWSDGLPDFQLGPVPSLSALTVFVIDPNDRPPRTASPARYELPVSLRFPRLTI